jgi:hypothetical protein
MKVHSVQEASRHLVAKCPSEEEMWQEIFLCRRFNTAAAAATTAKKFN